MTDKILQSLQSLNSVNKMTKSEYKSAAKDKMSCLSDRFTKCKNKIFSYIYLV